MLDAHLDAPPRLTPQVVRLTLKAHRDFHRELYAGCGNPLLIRMLDDLRDQNALVSAAAWRHEPGHARTPSREHEAAGHRAVLQAAEDGDAERAAILLRGHITSFAARNFPELQENQDT